MKVKVLASILGLASLALSSGCATMAENRVANDALDNEVQTVVNLWAAKSKTVRPVLIIGHNTERPNSAGGVDVSLSFENYSGKPIKYADFVLTAFNRVGDPTVCSVRGRSTVTLSGTGPFALNYSGNLRWENVWYNNTINFARLDSVHLEYMDGTKEEISGTALEAIQLRPENNVFSADLQQRRKVCINGEKIRVERTDIYPGY